MRVLLLVFAFSSLSMSYAQKKKLNLSDAVLKSYSSLAPERLSNLAWKTNISHKSFDEIKNQEFVYSGEVNGDPVYFKGNISSGKASVWLTAKEFKSLFSIHSKKPLARLPRINFIDNLAYIKYENEYHFVDINNNKYIDSLIIPDEKASIFTVSENGFGKRSNSLDFRKTRRGAKGVIAMQTSDRNGMLIGAAQVTNDDEVMLITDKGMLVRTRVAEINIIGRNTQGVTVIRLKDKEKLISIAPISEEFTGDSED